jgi:hypothetical protein
LAMLWCAWSYGIVERCDNSPLMTTSQAMFDILMPQNGSYSAGSIPDATMPMPLAVPLLAIGESRRATNEYEASTQATNFSTLRSRRGCACLAETTDFLAPNGPVTFRGCGAEGWCDVESGCAGAQEADGMVEYDGWDDCGMPADSAARLQEAASSRLDLHELGYFGIIGITAACVELFN